MMWAGRWLQEGIVVDWENHPAQGIREAAQALGSGTIFFRVDLSQSPDEQGSREAVRHR